MVKHVDAEQLALDLWRALNKEREDRHISSEDYFNMSKRIGVLMEMRARSEHYDFAPERKVEKNPAIAAPYGKPTHSLYSLYIPSCGCDELTVYQNLLTRGANSL